MHFSKQDYLVSNFPNLYRYLPYIETDDGWFDLILDMSEQLEKERLKLIAENPLLDQDACHLVQIKEKYGGLAVYLNSYHATYRFSQIIIRAENKSYTVCEVCGCDGKLRSELSWIKTLCDQHLSSSRGNHIKTTKTKVDSSKP